MYMHAKQMTLNSIIRIHVNDVRLTGGVHLGWFLSSAKPSFKGLWLDQTQSKSPSCLGPNQLSD